MALLEAALFYFVGRLVDPSLTRPTGAASSCRGLLAGLARILVFVAVSFWLPALVVALRASSRRLCPGFYNLVRWQAYAHVARQSLSFFQNDFAGRIVTKVWSGGQATGDFMISLLQVVWFIVIYTVTTMVLIAQLDWRLAALVGVWIAAFGVLAFISFRASVAMPRPRRKPRRC